MQPASAATSTNVHPPRKLAYMEQGCEMTLREGLDEYYTQIEGLITEDNDFFSIKHSKTVNIIS